MESILATSKQYRCIIISPKNIVFMTFYGVKIESFTQNGKQDNGQHKNHSCLVARSDFPSFFLSLLFFLSFFRTLSIHLSLFLFFSLLYVVVVFMKLARFIAMVSSLIARRWVRPQTL